MAQIRKHRPRTSSIGDQVRASVDSGPRPIVPGEEYDPFFEEPDDTAGEAAGGFEITASPPTRTQPRPPMVIKARKAAIIASIAVVTPPRPGLRPVHAPARNSGRGPRSAAERYRSNGACR